MHEESRQSHHGQIDHHIILNRLDHMQPLITLERLLLDLLLFDLLLERLEYILTVAPVPRLLKLL